MTGPDGKTSKLEVYDQSRFFTVTGRHLAGTPLTIEHRQEALEALYDKFFKGTGARQGLGSNAGAGCTPEGQKERLVLALRKDQKFQRLWNGDASEYGHDDSAADMALCNKLVFWFGPDGELVDGMFRRSGLCREKWERDDYSRRTINRALEFVEEYYKPPGDDNHGGDLLETVRQLTKESSPDEVQEALRSFASSVRGRPQLERVTVRDKAIQFLSPHMNAPARLVDAALAEGVEDPAEEAGHGLLFNDPEPWPEPVDGAELLDEVVAAVGRYLILDEGMAEAVALWIFHTHALDAFDFTPRLGITSPEKRCGKTTLEEILELLVPRPLLAANVSTAAVFRVIEAWKPTLVIDELDSFLSTREELRGVLNSGHRRGGTVIRTVGDDHEPAAFSTFAAVALAAIGDLPDTLADRAINIRMKRKSRSEKVERFRRSRVQRELAPLQRRASRWAADHLQQLKAADPQLPEELGDRQADNWSPLFAIADEAGGDWPERARGAALTLSGAAGGGENASAGEQVLADIREAFGGPGGRDQVARLVTNDLLSDLNAREDRPWPEWRQGDALSANQLAKLLKPFGIKPSKWRDGVKTVRGYCRASFEDAWERDPPQPPPSRPATPATGPVFNDLDAS